MTLRYFIQKPSLKSDWNYFVSDYADMNKILNVKAISFQLIRISAFQIFSLTHALNILNCWFKKQSLQLTLHHG